MTDINAILAKLKIPALNAMQQRSMEAIHAHDQVMVLANTGSGKTLAYLLPLLDLLKTDKPHPQAMIVVPSRELALQIDEVFRQMGTSHKVTLCYGGHKREIEETNLIEAPALLIGTAGRLADHIRRRNFNPLSIHTLILDEFDKSLELGFLEEMKEIVEALPNLQKKILTSATVAESIPDFLKLEHPTVVDYLSKEQATEIDLEVFTLKSPSKDKIDTLFQFCCFINHKPCVVFCNHRDAVERVSKLLTERGLKVSFYHGGMEQRDRESELCMFRNGTSNILITTDLASRGLDIPGIRYIVHYHLPSNEAAFTHRNGRTARMNDFGTAILLLSGEEEIPVYLSDTLPEFELADDNEIPAKTQWTTFHFNVGKKGKVNKIDIVGFLSQRGELKKDDIGLIEVKDFDAFAAVRRNKAAETLHFIKDQKIKNKKVMVRIAKSMTETIAPST
jgi:superfamily II DNA/RNA helicase